MSLSRATRLRRHPTLLPCTSNEADAGRNFSDLYHAVIREQLVKSGCAVLVFFLFMVSEDVSVTTRCFSSETGSGRDVDGCSFVHTPCIEPSTHFLLKHVRAFFLLNGRLTCFSRPPFLVPACAGVPRTRADAIQWVRSSCRDCGTTSRTTRTILTRNGTTWSEREGYEEPRPPVVRQQVRAAHPGRPRLLPGVHAGRFHARERARLACKRACVRGGVARCAARFCSRASCFF